MTEATALVSFSDMTNDYDFGEETADLIQSIQDHPKIKELIERKGPLGGYLCVARQEDGFPLLIIQFGEMPQEKLAGRFAFCQEKCRRLALHPEHMTSWESRDPDNDQYGGAIRGKRYLWSISGLPEPLDEVGAAMVAYAVDDLDPKPAREFLAANNNEYFAAELIPHHEFWAA